MGCIYNGVCSSLVALFSWQQVTNLAAVMAHCGISPSRYGSFSKLDLFSNSFKLSLMPGAAEFSSARANSLIYMLKRVGLKLHPCLTPRPCVKKCVCFANLNRTLVVCVHGFYNAVCFTPNTTFHQFV